MHLSAQYGLARVQYALQKQFQFAGQIRQHRSDGPAKMPGNAYPVDFREAFVHPHKSEVRVNETEAHRCVGVYGFSSVSCCRRRYSAYPLCRLSRRGGFYLASYSPQTGFSAFSFTRFQLVDVVGTFRHLPLLPLAIRLSCLGCLIGTRRINQRVLSSFQRRGTMMKL